MVEEPQGDIENIRGACKNDSHFFLTLNFLASDANDIDIKEEGGKMKMLSVFLFTFDLDSKAEGEEKEDFLIYDS